MRKVFLYLFDIYVDISDTIVRGASKKLLDPFSYQLCLEAEKQTH